MTKTSSAIAKPVIYDDAFITSVVPYGEADCIVRMFTRIHGRIAAFFRRGRTQKKGCSAAQAPALAKVGIIAGDQKLVRLASCDLVPEGMDATLKVFGYRVYIAELIEKLLPEEDSAEDIFALVEETYHALATHVPGHILRAFELKLLESCGYLPEMPTADEGSDITAFDPVACHFITEETSTSFAFSRDAIKLAQAMLIAKIGNVNYGEEYELLMIGRIFQSRLKVMGLFPLKSVAFLKQLSGRT